MKVSSVFSLPASLMLYVCPLPCRSYISSLFASEIIVEEKKSNGEREEPSTETNAKVRKYMSENEIVGVYFVFRFLFLVFSFPKWAILMNSIYLLSSTSKSHHDESLFVSQYPPNERRHLLLLLLLVPPIENRPCTMFPN